MKLALEYLQEKQKSSATVEVSSRKSLEDAYDVCQKRLDNLNREFTAPQNANYEIYTQDEFKTLKASILKERSDIQKSMAEIQVDFDHSLEESEKVFNFCRHAIYHFNTGNLKKKREILSNIGSNLTLKDKILIIEAIHPYLLIENELKAQRAINNRLERKNTKANKGRITISDEQILTWRASWVQYQSSETI